MAPLFAPNIVIKEQTENGSEQLRRPSLETGTPQTLADQILDFHYRASRLVGL